MPISNASTETPTSEQNDVDEEPAAAEPDYVQPQLRRSFELLTTAAMGQNPTQFQLPRELICTTALPGSSKTRRKEESTGENTKTQRELDHNGLTPLPKSASPVTEVAAWPLSSSDCFLLFHMNCLEPPLAAMPLGRWMCPNDIEHHVVKVDFLSRIHRHSANRRVLQSVKRSLKVPDAIKSQYQFPLLIAPAAIRDGELIHRGMPEESKTHLLNSNHLATRQSSKTGSVVVVLRSSAARLGGAVNVWYQTLYVVTGADVDVCLTNYVSGKRTCILYDESAKHYELLNYRGICTCICTQHLTGKRQIELRNSVGREGKANGLDTSWTQNRSPPTSCSLPFARRCKRISNLF
ncbi:hypothetical protein CB1_000071002 [Camelus ferus]|nr:hypothetical protein CB1_000071002 [Camelus ferus]